MRWQLSTLKARLFVLLMLVLSAIVVILGIYLLQYLLAVREIFIVMLTALSGGTYG